MESKVWANLDLAANGIVIATERKQSSVLVDDSTVEKVVMICKNIGLVYSGMGPDARVLVDKARKAAQEYKKIYMTEPPVQMLVTEVAAVMQEFTQSGFVQGLTSQWSPSIRCIYSCCWVR